MSPLKTSQGPKGRVRSAWSSPERSPPRVTFNEKEIKTQADQAAQRKAALRGKLVEGAGTEAPPKENMEKGENQTPKGGGFWKRKRERWKQRKAKGKGKGKATPREQSQGVELRRVEMK